MTRHRILALAAALLVATGLSGCSIGPINLDELLSGFPSVEEARAARRDELAPVVADTALKQAGTLTVGLPAAHGAPLAIFTEDGEATGISADIAHAVADELGISAVRFVSVSDVDSALAEQCDVVMGVEPDEGGSAQVLGSYAQSASAVFGRGDVTAPLDASSLAGASVGLQEGSVSAVLLDDYAVEVSRVHFPNLNEAFEALEAGEVSYVVCDAYAGAYLAGAYADIEFAGTLDDPVAVGVAVSSPELASAVGGALETIQSNGVGDIARAIWVGDLPSLSTESRMTGLVEREEPADPAEGESGEAEGEEASAE